MLAAVWRVFNMKCRQCPETEAIGNCWNFLRSKSRQNQIKQISRNWHAGNSFPSFELKRIKWPEKEIMEICWNFISDKICFEKIVKLHQVNLFMAGFSYLKPLCYWTTPLFNFLQPLIWWRPIEDLDWQGGDFRRHNKMIARSATRKGYRKIIHSLICQSLFKHAIVSMTKLAVYTKIERLWLCQQFDKFSI